MWDFSQPFCAIIQEIVWTSAHRYLILKRVEIAKDLLSETNHSLVDVAAQTGFSDQAALTGRLQMWSARPSRSAVHGGVAGDRL
jgi:transcriptional regulator GlxA family with amidase domain